MKKIPFQSSVLRSALLTAAMAPAAFLAAPAAHAEFSGNIGAFSKYVLRGITNSPENNDVAIQGGLDYSHESGFYAGWWASNLSYGDDSGGNGFENDFYLGYGGAIDNYSYGVGLIQYYYVDVEDSDLTEAVLNAGFDAGEAGSFGLTAQVLLNDGAWGNSGDTYLYASYEKSLPKDFTLGATLGYYFYDDSVSEYGVTTSEDGAFRHLDLSLSHPIGKTGADMGITYIVGGKDRMGTDQDNTVVLSVSYGFDI